VATAAVTFHGISKRYGDVVAVDALELEIADGEFFSLLGPSGSGKTTCLRVVGGFERPTQGRVRLFGEDVTDVPPYLRAVNTVFQDYALFPHLSVGENVAYGLRVKGTPREETERRVAEALEMVHLPNVAERRPHQLSGGQKQRVSLARALVNRPRILLLDEPLGALDLKLRRAMQVELKQLQKQVGITFLYVTHDQEEALAMSDRLAIFRAGRVEQVGTPREVYETPSTAFVADFVGASNRVDGALAERVGAPGVWVIRPEKLRLAPTGASDEVRLSGRVRDATFLGMYTRLTVDVGADLAVMVPNDGSHVAAPGDTVEVAFRRADLRPLAS
jgi:putative spermidine/putrescine transport system ATP-binding protein